MEHKAPTRYVATASKARRDGGTFIDRLHNSRGATSRGLFTATALRRATPLKGHPWGDFEVHGQALPQAD